MSNAAKLRSVARGEAASWACLDLDGGRTWWAHFEFSRINITPTILRYEKASARYPAYYRNVVLPRLERELRGLDSVSEDAFTASDKREHRLGRNKVVKEIAAVRARVR